MYLYDGALCFSTLKEERACITSSTPSLLPSSSAKKIFFDVWRFNVHKHLYLSISI